MMGFNHCLDEEDVKMFIQRIDLIVYLNSLKPHEREEDKKLCVRTIKNARNDGIISAEEALELVLYFIG